MPKKIFRNIFILIIANLLIKPLWIFGIDLKVQNITGLEDYGFYFVVFNFSFLFHIILDLGINQFNNREVAQDNSLLSKHFGQLLGLKLVFAFAYFVITFLLALSFGYTALQQKMLFYLALNQVLISFILFSRSNFTALQWYKWDAFFSVFDRVLSIVFCMVLLYTSLFGEFQLMNFIYAQTIALFISACLSIIVVFFKEHIIFPSLNFNEVFPLLKQALPYAIVVLLMTIYTRIDAIMLQNLLPETGNNEAGIYAAGYRILDALNMLPFLLASILIPYFAKQLKLKEDFTDVLWTAFNLMLAFCIPFALAIYFFHPEILSFLYTDSSSSWFTSFQYLMYAFPAVFLMYIFGGFITASARMKVIAVFALITIVVNLSLNYILIPQHGAAGAAFATLISQSIMAVSEIVYVFKNWNTKFKLKTLTKALFYFVLNIAIIKVLLLLSLPLLYNLILFAVITIILSLVLRLIDIKKLISL